MTENNGRENAKDNDLFFTCSLIDYIARKTKIQERTLSMLWGKTVLKKYMSWRMCITAII